MNCTVLRCRSKEPIFAIGEDGLSRYILQSMVHLVLLTSNRSRNMSFWIACRAGSPWIGTLNSDDVSLLPLQWAVHLRDHVGCASCGTHRAGAIGSWLSWCNGDASELSVLLIIGVDWLILSWYVHQYCFCCFFCPCSISPFHTPFDAPFLFVKSNLCRAPQVSLDFQEIEYLSMH